MINKALGLLRNREFIMYSGIGITGVIIDLLLYFLLVSFHVPAVVASVISVSAGIVNNFLLNARFNFKRRDHLWRRFGSFYAVGVTGIVLSALFILLLHGVFDMDAALAKIISVPFIVFFQYWFNKNTAFAENHQHVPWKPILLFGSCIGVLALFVFNAPYFSFVDENDNLLGAQFIANGGVIYKEYFSHHMPLVYFIGAPFFLIFGTDLVAIKVAFGLLMALWLLYMSRRLFQKFGVIAFIAFTGLVAVTQMLAWTHMLLAETLIAFAVCHALILFITDTQRRSLSGDLALYAILGAVPILSALPYAPLSLLIYLLAFITIIKEWGGIRQHIRPLFVFLSVAALPYAAFLLYLYLTQSFGELREQAISFNTLYYSQFTPSSPVNLIDGAFSVIQGAASSFADTIIFQAVGAPQPISALFAVSILGSIALLVKSRFYLLSAAFLIAVLFSAGRYGFSSVFTDNGNARAGSVLVLLGLLIVVTTVFYMHSYKKVAKRIPENIRFIYFSLISLLLIVLLPMSLEKMADTGRLYARSTGTISPALEPGSAATIVNLVAAPSDHYWVGPLDFSSQIIIKAQPASIHRFYAPWHAVCPECSAQLLSDLNEKRPKVIVFDTDMNIWGNLATVYAEPVLSYIETSYYQVRDPRLKHAFFSKSHKDSINISLKKAGYDL